jgi:hypothetical protein
MSRTKINKVYVVGTMAEVKTQVRTSDSGKTYINGSIVVKTTVNGVENLVELKVLAFEKKTDGTDNKQFASYKLLDGMLGKKVRVSGRLQEGTMINQSGEIIHFNEIYANFVNAAKAEDVECSTFEYSGFVVKPLYERKNKDDELLGYRIEVAQANYNDTAMSVLKFDVDKDDTNIAQAIEANYETGATVKFNGNLIYTSRTETKTEQVAFGDPIVKNITISDKSYRITGGDAPFEEDGPDTYTVDEIKKFVADYKAADAERLAKEKEKATAPAAAPTNSGAAGMAKLTRPSSLI